MPWLEHFLTPSSLQQDRSVECFLLSASIEIILENSRSITFNQRAACEKPFLDFDRDRQFFSFLVYLTWTVYKSLKRTYAVSNWKHVIHLHWRTRGKPVLKLVHRLKMFSKAFLKCLFVENSFLFRTKLKETSAYVSWVAGHEQTTGSEPAPAWR